MALTRKQVVAALTRDFETSMSNSSTSGLKKQCDRLANFAYIAMKHLEDNDMLDFVILKHDDLSAWYKKQKEELAKVELAKEAKLRKAEVRARALARLTDEEKAALGIKK